MADNPYQAPEAESQVAGIPQGTREDLRGVAQAQKGILVCILIYFIAVFGQFLLPPPIRIFLGIGILLVALAGAFFVFRLAIKVYGSVVGILLGILTLIPLLGLLILLIINGKATSILKANGIRVGMMGADLTRI